jgi:hypothetical protein
MNPFGQERQTPPSLPLDDLLDSVYKSWTLALWRIRIPWFGRRKTSHLSIYTTRTDTMVGPSEL